MHYIYSISGPSLLIESTDSDITRGSVVTSMGRASANPTQVQIIIFGIQIRINFMIDSRLWLEHVSSYSSVA